jgi:hypothetical protein
VGTDFFFIHFSEIFEQRVCEYTFDSHPLFGVELDDGLDQMLSFWFDIVKHRSCIAFLLILKFNLAYHGPREITIQGRNISWIWIPRKLYNLLQLLQSGTAIEQGPPRINLKDNTAETPDIRGILIGPRPEQHLRSPIPPGGDALSHDRVLLVLGRGHAAHKSEVAELDVAVGVEENVGGFQVAVDQVGAVQVFQGFGDLVHDVFVMHLFQDALRNYVVQVGLHVLEHQVDILPVLGLYALLELYDVVVVQLPQDADLAVGALGVCGMLESVEDLFEGVDALVGLLLDFPDVPVCTAAHFFQQLESLEDVGFNFRSLRHEADR